jgi:hypothetical protein
MSTTTDAREALFTGKDDVVRSTYDRLLEALHTVGPFQEEPKKTSLHLVHRVGFAGVHPRKSYLLLNLRTDLQLRANVSRKQNKSQRAASIMR